MTKKKTYMINHLPIKQMWLGKKNYINKRCTKMGGSKNAKEPNEKKRLSIIYLRTKVQKVSNSKNEGVKKT